MIQLTVPSIEDADLRAVETVLASGFLAQGQNVATFEEGVAAYVGARQGVALSSCTAALHLSLLSVGIQPGDVVLVPAYSWPATANVVELCGGRPLFVDIEFTTYNMDPNRLEERLRELHARRTRPRVRAIMPVHAFGRHADMASIMDLATQYELPVIEDAACALGARANGRPAGRWGRTGCYSFHPRKPITTGEGGIVVTDDTERAREIRALRNHGLDPEARTADFVTPGFNYRLTEIQASLGISQMKKLDRILAARREAALRYGDLLSDSGLRLPDCDEPEAHTYQSYVVLLPPDRAAQRDELISGWKERGIEMTIGTIHIPMTSYYRTQYGFSEGDFPVTDEVAARAVTLPLYAGLEERAQHRVAEVVRASLD